MSAKQPATDRILRELLMRLSSARVLVDVNIAAGIALNELEGKSEER